MYTKDEAIQIVTKRFCNGLCEDDHEQMKSSGKPFRTLREDRTDKFKYGWIFSCPATRYNSEGERDWMIGGGLRVAFNRTTGKIQKVESGFSVENFRRTGDIHKGCNEHSLIISCYVDPWAERNEPNIDGKVWAMSTFRDLLMTHTDKASESIRELVERFFTPKEELECICLDAKSVNDANNFVEGIVQLNEEAQDEYEYFGFEIHCISYYQVKKYGGYRNYIRAQKQAQDGS